MDINEMIDGLSSDNGGKQIADVSRESVVKKIRSYLPVPNDVEIKWAEIGSYGGYPSGIVLTNKGIFIKASRKIARTFSDKDGKDRGKKRNNVIYRYIPWDYYDPEGFQIKEKIQDGNRVFSIFDGDRKITEFYDESLYHFFLKLQHYSHSDETADILSDASVAADLEIWGLDAASFNAAYGADNSNTGHGIYAEKATTILERAAGDKVAHTGGDNAKNGPDKIVNGFRVQCKYCKTADSSVGACFETDPNTGKKVYRYIGPNNKPMLLEVPKDQYDNAVEAMRRRILKGEVPGVTDPDQAKNIIRKGKLTYAQVRNLAKAGTIESLTYDAVTGIVSCTAICGVSAIIAFAITYWQTKDKKKAASVALETGLQVFGPSFVGMILASQIARTSIPHSLIPATTAIAKWIDPKTVQSIVNAFRALVGKKPIYGAAAQNSFAKALRSTVLTQAIMFCVTAIPDTVRVIDRKITGAQYTKNLLSSGSSVTGAFGGSLIAGKIADKFFKGKPVVVKIIGTGVAMIAGFISGTVTKLLLNLFKEDDIIIFSRMFNAIVTAMCMDYVLSEKELNVLISMLDKDSKRMQKILGNLNKSEYQYADIERFLTPYFEKIAKKRPAISSDVQQEMYASINEILSETVEGVIAG